MEYEVFRLALIKFGLFAAGYAAGVISLGAALGFGAALNDKKKGS